MTFAKITDGIMKKGVMTMITIALIVILLGVLFLAICMGAVFLIDPIIAILIIVGLFKLISKLTSKKK